MADEPADEIKVFRREDAEDLETAQSSDQLAEDKKEAALETELEARPNGAAHILERSAFQPAVSSPCYPGMGMGLLGGSLSPAFLTSMYMPWMNPAAVAYQRGLAAHAAAAAVSPSFMNPMGMMGMAPASPAFASVCNAMQMHLFGPSSPIHAAVAMAAQRSGQVPLAPNMRPGALNQMTNMRLPAYNGMGNLPQDTTPKRSQGERRKDHIKKPLNAFMWYMKENRPKLMEELGYKEKQSAELNKELGKRWHQLKKEEQKIYFELAQKDREEHKAKYPQWSARENYAIHKKKKRKREKTEEMGDAKKCRARFGVSNVEQWCKFCKRKKKCMYSMEGSRSSSSTEPSLPGDGSHLLGSELLNGDDDKTDEHVDMMEDDVDVSDSESEGDEVEEDDPTLTQQALEKVALAQDQLMV